MSLIWIEVFMLGFLFSLVQFQISSFKGKGLVHSQAEHLSTWTCWNFLFAPPCISCLTILVLLRSRHFQWMYDFGFQYVIQCKLLWLMMSALKVAAKAAKSLPTFKPQIHVELELSFPKIYQMSGF